MSIGAPIIEVDHLVRDFGGLRAVDDLSFSIHTGEVVGFIGANGAGKTTTMRMLATLEVPDAGRIRIGGHDVVEDPLRVRGILGWMPDSYGTYANVTVTDYLDFYARAYGFHGSDRERRVREVMEFADLIPLADRRMDKLSKGMAQRLCFGRTLLHDPRVLILDEPAAGLDPKARVEFKNLVRILAARGATILISSHILSELSEMCDTVLFIDNGRIVHHGKAADLIHQAGGALVEIAVDGPVEPLEQWLSMHAGWKIESRTKTGLAARFEGSSPAELADALGRMVRDGVRVSEFHRRGRRLEEAFVDMLKDRQNGEPS